MFTNIRLPFIIFSQNWTEIFRFLTVHKYISFVYISSDFLFLANQVEQNSSLVAALHCCKCSVHLNHANHRPEQVQADSIF